MREWVGNAMAEGVINTADTAFADFMQTLAANQSESLWSASVLASAAIQNGDVCVSLSDVIQASACSDATTLRSELQQSGVVQQPAIPITMPLVLDDNDRLYLSRYWQAERDLAQALQSRLSSRTDSTHLTPDRALLDQLFPPQNELPTPDWQRVAAVVAARQQLCVITGGPGTGKTRTVARLLAVLQAQSAQPVRIALLAPTGKAAARLLESLRAETIQLEALGLSVELPDDASTLHRALGYQPGRAGFRHNASFPLPFDLVLVDEASMVDLSLMHSLVCALADDTRLILLGDRDQLASVEAGNVLGDIVGDATPAHYSADQRTALINCCNGFDAIDIKTPTGGVADAIVELQHSYRFDAQSGIGHFARAVNAGDFETASATSQNPDFADLNFIDPASTTLQQQLLAQAVPAAEAVIESATIEEALKTSLAYRVLCAMHAGPRGVEAINNIIEARLTRLGHIQPRQLWYRGRPILITRNDPGTRLYNGDTGLIWPDASGHMMAWFPDTDTGVRAIAPGRLPAHQTCYAMTVHKTQGSEFTRVLLVLPEAPHSLLSRDLLYTGITRARRVGEIYADTAALQFACETRRERVSGLRGWLWG